MKRAKNPVFAIVLTMLLASAVAYADGDAVVAVRATSVAEMLQSKHEAALREQYALQGRWDAVREIDQAQAQRQEAQKKRALTRINGQLTVAAPAESQSMDSLGTLCAPIRTSLPGAANSFAAGPGMGNQGTMQVR